MSLMSRHEEEGQSIKKRRDDQEDIPSLLEEDPVFVWTKEGDTSMMIHHQSEKRRTFFGYIVNSLSVLCQFKSKFGLLLRKGIT